MDRAWVGPLYWIQWAGDTAAYIPAGGGPVREANSASRTVRCRSGALGLYGACARLSARSRFGRKSTVAFAGK